MHSCRKASRRGGEGRLGKPRFGWAGFVGGNAGDQWTVKQVAVIFTRIEPMHAPSLRQTIRLVREANAAWDGGEYGRLCYSGNRWTVLPVPAQGYGTEWLPGDGEPLDAVAVARRLLAAFRDTRACQRNK